MRRRTFMAAGAATAGFMFAGTGPADSAPTEEKPFNIGMLMFANMTYLDFAGPNDLWARPRNSKVYALAKTLDVIKTDTGTRILPDTTLNDAPDLDLIFIGGGLGVVDMMRDNDVLDFLQKRAPGARYITSVCTGALVLGAAGLLRGYKATTHWTALDILPVLGAEPIDRRVVIDRNRITGGGVTTGIDFGLTVAAEIWGKDTAQLLQLGSEYNPEPPFDAGSPEKAPAPVVERLKNIWKRQTDDRRAAAIQIAATFQ